LKDRLRILTVLAERGGRRVRRALASPGRAAGNLRIKTPERLLIAPQDIRTSDPTIAADVSAGYFAFGGRIVNAHGRSPFVAEAQTEEAANATWARQLAGFGWLRHLRAADNPAARQRGRALVDEFLSVAARPSPGPAWDPKVTARRMLAWLSQSPVILDGADRAFYNRFMHALATHRFYLERQLTGGLVGDDRLLVALALAEFGLCAQGAGAFQKRATQALAAEIDAQVLPDGGHISRSPQALIDLLLDLLPLRQAYAARGIQAPQQVLNAIDRMMPMLRLFRHGDGTLALFNGMGVTAPELVATILAYDDARAQPLANARYAGYQRLEAGQTLVIVDSGAAPPPSFSTQAHAGCLAFELSSGLRRIVVNCGAPESARANAREAARTTAAHSTLIIDDTSSCRFASNAGLQRWLGDQILAGPVEVSAERSDLQVAMAHDGYAERFKLLHHRRLALSADGTRLDGHDRLVETGKRKAGGVPYALRFHLHPTIKPQADAGTIRLDMPDGESWLFEAALPAEIELSVLFAMTGGPRRTTQIKVAADSAAHPELQWSFRQLAARRR
jgi:uncharacterized heparinase superfamily protein